MSSFWKPPATLPLTTQESKLDHEGWLCVFQRQHLSKALLFAGEMLRGSFLLYFEEVIPQMNR